MCYMLYLGSENTLPEIPPPDWRTIDFDADDWGIKAPRLIVTRLAEGKMDTRIQFTESTIVYAGSYEGCGCGFNYCVNNAMFNSETRREKRLAILAMESRIALAEYVELNGVSSLFGCWDGDQGLSREAKIEVTATQLRDPMFSLPKRVLMQLTS